MTDLQNLIQQGYADTRIRVRYAETDQMGIVYYANYLVWFEVGRAEFIRQLGIDYKTMEEEEHALIAVVEATARYKSPARYDDEIIIRTTLSALRGSIIRFRYTILRSATPLAAEQVLAEGETVHMVVGRDMKRRKMPPTYTERFSSVMHAMLKPR